VTSLHRFYQIIGKLLLLAICCIVLFVAGVLGTFKTNLLIYGEQEFDGNAGAGVAVLLEGVFVGFFLALGGIPLSIHLSARIPWLRQISNRPL
jgi:hypothetical protein